jgi:hypothetical protein
MLPSITLKATAEDREVSEMTFAETWALGNAPNAKMPHTGKNVAAYRTCGLDVARNMLYPTIEKGAHMIRKMPRLSSFQLV